jgi:WD40 repeat protein/Tfp pilus assembly protein PilF
MSDEPSAPSDDELLQSILVDILQAMDAGRPLPPLSEIQARHPRWAEELAVFYDGEELAQALQGLGPSPRASLSTAAAPRSGARFGNYEILEELGRGGMGIVYRARHVLLDKEVALKVVRSDRLESLSPAERLRWIERFRAEAKAVAALDRHPNLVTLFEVGDWDGRPFFTMQLIRGGSLAGRIAARRKLEGASAEKIDTSLPVPAPASQPDPSPPAPAERDIRDGDTIDNCVHTEPFPRQAQSTVASRHGGPPSERGVEAVSTGAARSQVRRADAALLAKVARAVDYAHRRGILHRDLKPGNILLDEDGEPLVSDFGLARRLDETGSLVSGAIEGTAAYMSPEQARGTRGSLDVTADVYALGAVLYELLTGQPPFRGMNDVETLLQVINLNPTPPRAIDPSIERDLEVICLKCLEKEPGRRYETAAALAEDLENWLAGRTIDARPAGSGERFVRWCRRNPWIAGLGAAALVFLVAGSVASTAFAFRAQANADESGRNAKKAQDNEKSANTERSRAQTREQEAVHRFHAAQLGIAYRDWQAGLLRNMSDVLETLRPKLDEEDLRGFEWHYLNGLPHQDRMTVRVEPKDRNAEWADFLLRVRYSPDDRQIAVRLTEGVSLRDATTGQEVRFFALPSSSPFGNHLAFNPVEKHIASQGTLAPGEGAPKLDEPKKGYKSAIIVWDRETGKEVYRIPDASSGFAYHPDGKILAAQFRSEVRLFDARDGTEIGKLKDPDDYPLGSVLAFSPDGKWLAMPFRPPRYMQAIGIRVWDFESRKVVHTLLGHRDAVAALAFAPDSQSLASGSWDRSVRIWDLQHGKTIQLLSRIDGDVNDVQFSPGGVTLAVAYVVSAFYRKDTPSVALLYSTSDWHRYSMLRGHTGSVTSVHFRHRLRELDGLPENIKKPAMHKLYSSYAELATCSYDGTLKIWDIRNSFGQWPEADAQVPLIGSNAFGAMNSDGRRIVQQTRSVAVSRSQTIEEIRTVVHDTRQRERLRSFSSLPLLSGPSILSPDGKLLAQAGYFAAKPPPDQFSGPQGEGPVHLVIWDVDTGERRAALPLAAPLSVKVFTGDGTKVLLQGARQPDLTDGPTIHVWDWQTGVELAAAEGTMLGQPAPRTGWIAIGLPGRRVRVWDPATNCVLHEWSLPPGDSDVPWTATFSPDGSRLAVVEHVWVTISGRTTIPDSSRVHVFNWSQPSPLLTFHVHSVVMTALFHPAQNRLITGDNDRAIKFWDLLTGQETLALVGHAGAVRLLAFSPDGHQLISADGDIPNARVVGWGGGGEPPKYSVRIWDATPLPDDSAVHYRLGNELASQGRYPEAEAEYREALRLKPDSAEIHSNLGDVLCRLNRHPEAEAEHREALRLDPNLPEAYCNRGLSLRDQGRFAEALTELRRGHELGAKRTDWRNPSADWVRQLEALLEIDRRLEAIVRGQTEGIAPEDLLAYALIRQQQGQRDEAVKLLEQVVALRPAVLDYRRRLADSLAEAKDHARLAKAALDMSRMSPDGWLECHSAVFYLTRCVSLAQQDTQLSEAERKSAVQQYEKARQEMLQEAARRGSFVVKDVIEAEWLPVVEAKQSSVNPQNMSPWGAEKWSKGHQILCRAARGGSVVLEVAAPAKGDYRLDIYFTKAPDFGIVEVSVDDQKVGRPFDSFEPDVIPSGKITVGTVTLDKGPHRIRFTAVDKNPKSSNYFMGIDCLKLEPLGAK